MAGQVQQHVVNRTYLEFFCDPADGETIWMADLKTVRIARSQPAKVGKRRHYYSYEHEGKKRTDVEDMLSKIEHAALPVLQKFQQFNFNLDRPEATDLAVYLATMILRVPSRRNPIEDFYRQIAKTSAALLFQEPGRLEATAREMGMSDEEIAKEDYDGMRDFYEKFGHMIDIKVDPAVSLRHIVENAEDIANTLLNMSLTLVFNVSDSNFITSDNPVSIHNPLLVGSVYGAGIGQPDVEITIPINPRVCLLFRHGRRPRTMHVNALMVWEINSRIMGGRDRFAFGSKWIDAFYCLKGHCEGLDIEGMAPWERPLRKPGRYKLE